MINAPRRTNDPKHWRDRAAQIRALALTITDSETTILMNDLAADCDKLADRAAIKANGKKPPTNAKPRQACRYDHDPRSDLSSIFRNKVAVPTLAFHEARQTRLRRDMVDDRPPSDRPPSGCEPESDCAAGTLPYLKTAAAQSAVWTRIGQELRACYEVPQDLPPEMLALLMQLNDRREEK